MLSPTIVYLNSSTASHGGRKGVVRKDGRNWRDDTGVFYPYGGTLFWALHGWKFEQDRYKKNAEYLTRWCDYVRILCEVGWAGNDIRPDWPDYQQVLGEVIDYHHSLGMRTELTVIGGGTGVDPLQIAQLVAQVALSRPEKIMDIEMANEAFQNLPDFNMLVNMAKVFKSAGVQNLLALSSAEGGLLSWNEVLAGKMVPPGVADIMTYHPERANEDDGWRNVRQSWDVHDMPYPVAFNEPVGPRSSVAECTDPMQLAMFRATGIICGAGAFVLHNGAGVAGQIDPAHNRPANLWEVPGIDNIMQVVRNVDAALPDGAGSGQHWNTGWQGCPFVADAFWTDGADHGVNRAYVAEIPGGFLCPIDGIKDYVIFSTPQACRVDLWDVIENKVINTVTFTANGSFRIESHSRDHAGYGAFIARGTYL